MEWILKVGDPVIINKEVGLEEIQLIGKVERITKTGIVRVKHNNKIMSFRGEREINQSGFHKASIEEWTEEKAKIIKQENARRYFAMILKNVDWSSLPYEKLYQVAEIVNGKNEKKD